ncbi:hypothetical protein AB0C50_00555 [Micromonospora taraxaci]|uniref:hypothetical protein n=1 Tax=Micromonospora taraxaci TaxID=1316803 RepID=UPI0033D88097
MPGGRTFLFTSKVTPHFKVVTLGSVIATQRLGSIREFGDGFSLEILSQTKLLELEAEVLTPRICSRSGIYAIDYLHRLGNAKVHHQQVLTWRILKV